MELSPITVAIPAFFLLMGAEILYQRRKGIRGYRLNDALTSIGCGTVEQVFGIYHKVLLVLLYHYFYSNWALFDIPRTWGWYACCFVAADLAYYWLHRKAHEINLFWGGHAVHHQSEDYNLSTALRQGSTQFLWSLPFYVPIALLGFDTATFLSAYAFVTLYQFWIHTESIGRLGPLEWILNTPSHHRVHHGRDPKYIDKNYAGVFIIWDRLFGTFQREEERPHYGITTPLNSWNPLWANFSHYAVIWKEFWELDSWKERLLLLWEPPGWRPQERGGQRLPKEVPPGYHKYDRLSSNGMGRYVLVQFLVAMAFVTYLLFNTAGFSGMVCLLWSLASILTPTAIGGLMERRSWALPVELGRLALMAGLLLQEFGLAGLFPTAVWLGASWWLLPPKSQLSRQDFRST